MYVSAKVPASCGELAQGFLLGEPFLITCPVDIYAEAIVSDEFVGRENLGWKAAKALELWLAESGRENFPFGVRLRSNIPQGKGMASSSADIAAVLAAAVAALGENIAPEEIARIAAQVEPTDGVFFPGLVRINYMSGEVKANLGVPPKMNLIIFDSGGTVDTLDFHEKAAEITEDKTELGSAIELFASLDAAKIGEGATISARLNQSRLPKPRLEELIDFVTARGALGVTVAHSGTVIGVLLPADLAEELLPAHAANIGWRFPELRFLATAHLIPGGIELEVRP